MFVDIGLIFSVFPGWWNYFDTRIQTELQAQATVDW